MLNVQSLLKVGIWGYIAAARPGKWIAFGPSTVDHWHSRREIMNEGNFVDNSWKQIPVHAPPCVLEKILAFTLNGVPDSNSDEDIARQIHSKHIPSLTIRFVFPTPESSFTGNRARFRTRFFPIWHNKDRIHNFSHIRSFLISVYVTCAALGISYSFHNVTSYLCLHVLSDSVYKCHHGAISNYYRVRCMSF